MTEVITIGKDEIKQLIRDCIRVELASYSLVASSEDRDTNILDIDDLCQELHLAKPLPSTHTLVKGRYHISRLGKDFTSTSQK